MSDADKNGKHSGHHHIAEVLGGDCCLQSPVQRCRNHKVKNFCDKLPDELALQGKGSLGLHDG